MAQSPWGFHVAKQQCTTKGCILHNCKQTIENSCLWVYIIGEAVMVQVDGCLHVCVWVGGGECAPNATSLPQLMRSSDHGQNTSTLSTTKWSHSSARAYSHHGGWQHCCWYRLQGLHCLGSMQSTHLIHVSLECHDDTVRDMDVMMHNRAIGMAWGWGQDMVEPTETPDLRTWAWHHGA